MEAITLPNTIKLTDLGENKYSAILEPLYPGYGVTIGNAMRRVLLSSLPGAAATAVKIKYVDHEFSTIPNIKEDVIQIILNLKQLRVKSYATEPVKIFLKEKGEKIVTAQSFKENNQVQIINKDLHIATLDNKSADLEMELIIEQGRGYSPVEARENQKLEMGMIAIDAIFTPIKTVHFDVSNVRVGQFTNYDRLEIVIETDGTMNGQETINIASHILVDHFTMLFISDYEKTTPKFEKELATETNITEQIEAGNDIRNSTLSTRAKNALIKNNFTTLDSLKTLSNEQIADLSGLGSKSIKEIMDFLGRQQAT